MDVGASIDPPRFDDTDLPFPPPCSLKQFLAAGKRLDLNEPDVRACWDYYNQRGWKTTKGMRIYNATSTLRNWRRIAEQLNIKPKKAEEHVSPVYDGDRQ